MSFARESPAGTAAGGAFPGQRCALLLDPTGAFGFNDNDTE